MMAGRRGCVDGQIRLAGFQYAVKRDGRIQIETADTEEGRALLAMPMLTAEVAASEGRLSLGPHAIEEEK
jgi:hypothetical protein